MGISLALTDAALAEAVEPGTPAPKARLGLIRRLRDAGLPCGVMAMPILPWLTDTDEALDGLFAALAAAGATGVTAGPLHLRPGAREWFLSWLSRNHRHLLPRYRDLYGSGSYASKEYTQWLTGRIRHFRKRHGLPAGAGFMRSASAGREGSGEEPAGGTQPQPAGGRNRPGARTSPAQTEPTLF